MTTQVRWFKKHKKKKQLNYKEETMKKYGMFLLSAVAVIAVVMSMTACSKSSSGGGGGAVASTPTSTTQSREVASSGTQGVNMGSGSATTFQNLGQIGMSSAVGAPPMRIAGVHTTDPGLAKSAKLSARIAKSGAVLKAVAALHKAKAMGATNIISSTTITCEDGGTINFSGSVDDVAMRYELNLIASSCRESGSTLNGAMVISGSNSSSGAFTVTEKLGTSASDKLSILEFSDNNYSVLVSKMETLITLSMNGTVNATTGAMTSVTMGANGTMSILDYFSQGTYDMTFTNFSIVLSDTVATSGIETAEFTVSGGFSETWTDTSVTPNVAMGVSMTFSSFKISDEYATATAAAYKESITGGFSIDFTPDDCLEGAYTFSTVTPINYNASGMTTAGEIIINTVVDVTFLADGTITVTMNGTSVYSGDEYGLAAVCDFQTLDEPAPTTSGSNGSTTGDTMTITLSWDGPGGVSASDMDLHMNYYATASPIASTVGTSYVDYHGDTASCTNGGYSGMDLAGDGTCEIALDFDDVDGYGPEHITASSLPAGYYVVSVNSYSLHGDASSDANVSIQIGSSVFGPYTYTFTTSDSEGTTSSAWFAVADIVVASTGNVTVQAHNTSLPLWHGGTFGMAAAIRAKGIR